MHIAYVTDHFTAEPSGLAQATLRSIGHLRRAGHSVQWLRPARRRDEQFWPDATETTPNVAALRRLLHAQRPDVMHVASAGPLAMAALRAARAEGIAASTDFRSRHGIRLAERKWGPRRELWGLRRLHALADTSFVTPAMRAGQLAELGVAAIPAAGRGVDADAFSPAWRDPWLRKDWHAGAGEPVLLFVGALAPHKNPQLALRAFERVRREQPALRMVVVGDGPLRAALEREHPRARFAGVQVGTELARHIASADLLLYPALGDSGGTAALEAMASGLGVVAFDSSAAAAYACDGVSGFLASLEAASAPVQADTARAGHGALALIAARKSAPPSADATAEHALAGALRRALPHAHAGSTLRLAARAAAERADWTRTLRGFESGLAALAERSPVLPGPVQTAPAPLMA